MDRKRGVISPLEDRMYKCPYCGAEFLNEQDYNSHILTCKPKIEETKEVKKETVEEPKKKEKK